MVNYKLLVKGQVQGVNFRRSTKIFAEKYGIKGYVKNLSDGDVEIVCQGTKNNLDMFMKELKVGNPYAQVEDIDIEKIEEKDFEFFEIRY